MRTLTRTNAITLRYIEWYWWRFHYMPTQEHLAEAFGISVVAIRRRVAKLGAAGYLVKINNRYLPRRVMSEEWAA